MANFLDKNLEMDVDALKLRVDWNYHVHHTAVYCFWFNIHKKKMFRNSANLPTLFQFIYTEFQHKCKKKKLLKL